MSVESGAWPARSLLGAAIVLGLWPHATTLEFAPMTLDAVHWIQRAHGAERWQWIFESAHFIAYRPVTALSYAWTGSADSALGHRVFDLLLHAANGALVYLLARQVAAPARWVAALAAALFLLHPVSEEVVPWLARRSYSLATLFSLAALALAGRDTRHAGRGILAGLLSALAVCSNEVAFVSVAMLPAWCYSQTALGPSRAGVAARVAAPSLVAAALAVLLRSSFVDGVGGYAPDASVERFAAVFAGFWRDLVAFRPDATVAPARVALGVLGLLGCVGQTLSALREGRPLAAPLLVMVVWLLFASLVLGAQNVWFARELLPLVPALALLLALCSADAWPTRRAALAAPALVMVALLGTAPALRGPAPDRLARWQATQRVVDDVAGVLDAATEPTWIGLGLAYDHRPRAGSVRARASSGAAPRFLRLAPRWLEPQYRAAGHRIETVLALPDARPGAASVFEMHGTAVLRVAAGQVVETSVALPALEGDTSLERSTPLHHLGYPAGLAARFYLRVGDETSWSRLPRRRS